MGNTCVMRFKTLIIKGIRSRVNGFERIGTRLWRGGVGGVGVVHRKSGAGGTLCLTAQLGGVQMGAGGSFVGCSGNVMQGRSGRLVGEQMMRKWFKGSSGVKFPDGGNAWVSPTLRLLLRHRGLTQSQSQLLPQGCLGNHFQLP